MFQYRTAFGGNIGWVTPAEQETLRQSRVAIAGLGGVGGSHLLTLARLGIGAFSVADLDRFELGNLNRQAGATMPSLGEPKVDTLCRHALGINPSLDLRAFPGGVHRGNVVRFLDGADVYVDGLDFFASEARRLVFAECERRRIPAITAAPLGMGAAVVTFLPGGMSFEDYFGLADHPPYEQVVRFMVGLSPAMLQRSYLVFPQAVDFYAERGPSTAMACDLCAGIAATQVLKILLHRGSVVAAPRALQFDAYRDRFVKSWRPGGHRNPLLRLQRALVRRRLARMREKEKGSN